MNGATLANRYRLGTELGEGAMGVVYRAHDDVLARDVAVKVLSATSLTDEARERLVREARAAAQLNHPNIVTVHDAGAVDGTPYIVMELVDGASLHEAGALTISEVIDVARQLSAALEHAHSHGIIHRDLKPENVLVVRRQDHISVKLMDFGLARSYGATRLTHEGALVGTVFYLAPEQALGQEIDGRADLYSLGVLLYELTTGRLPFSGDDPLMVISQQLYAPVVPPRTYRPEIPPALDVLIVRLLAKNPADRPASAAEVLHALDEISLPETPAEITEADTTDTVLLLEQLARGRLIGRRRELKELRELLARGEQGQVHLVLISGEPGVVKTRLAHELMVYAQLSGSLVLEGGCYEYEATTAYFPVMEALRTWVHSQTEAELRERLDGISNELVKLAPEIETKLGHLAPNPPLPANEERIRLFDNVVRFMQSLAGKRGLLLFIDDLQWADQGTLGLLHYLLRNVRSERVLILAAYREVELDRAHPLAAALVDWNRERLAVRVSLGRLSLEDTQALLAALFGQESVSPEFAEAIYRETEGNPFFIEEVVKALIEQGQIYREHGRWGRKEIAELTIPQSIKEAIGRRLDRLSEACADILHTAAALGKTFAFEELAATANASENQILDALDEASASQLIRSEEVENYAFTHDKIREVLYEELNPIRRRRLHQRLGEGLEKLYTSSAAQLQAHVQDLAYHFSASGDLERGLRYSIAAATKTLSLFALDDALRYYEQARESAEALGLNDQLAVIYEGMGDVYSRSGPVSSAVEKYEWAIAVTASRQKRGALMAKIGSNYTEVGDARGLKYIHSALDDLDPETQANETAAATAMLGRYYHYLANHSKAIEYLERARALAEPLDDASTVTRIYAYLAGARQHLGQFYESMEWAGRCIALGKRKSFPLAEATGNEFLAEDSLAVGNWEDALGYSAQDHKIGEKIGALDRVAWSDYTFAWTYHNLGNLSKALQATQESIALAERLGDARLAIMGLGLLGEIQSDLGFDMEARAAAEAAIARADKLRHVVIQTLTRTSLAYCYLGEEDWRTAFEMAEQAFALIDPTENCWMRLTLGPIHAEAAVGMGDLEKAWRVSIATLALAKSTRSRHWEAMTLRVQGQVLTQQEQPDKAADVFDEAARTLEELGSRLELGRVLYRRGLLREASGQAGAARFDLERAREVFAECGASRDQAKADQALQSIHLA